VRATAESRLLFDSRTTTELPAGPAVAMDEIDSSPRKWVKLCMSLMLSCPANPPARLRNGLTRLVISGLLRRERLVSTATAFLMQVCSNSGPSLPEQLPPFRPLRQHFIPVPQ
jgi:hypothetical protein